MPKEYILRHVNSGTVKIMSEKHAQDFIYSPSWEMIDRNGNVIPKPKKTRKPNPVQEPPKFKKRKPRTKTTNA